jgi:hypothetical protein
MTGSHVPGMHPSLADVPTLRLLAEEVLPELREHYPTMRRQLAGSGDTA